MPSSKSGVLGVGLTLGLLSLDMNGLKVLQEGGDPAEREHARLITPIREKGNLLLCVLLTGNIFPIMLHTIISTTCVSEYQS